jgi:hypothetical protein
MYELSVDHRLASYIDYTNHCATYPNWGSSPTLFKYGGPQIQVHVAKRPKVSTKQHSATLINEEALDDALLATYSQAIDNPFHSFDDELRLGHLHEVATLTREYQLALC